MIYNIFGSSYYSDLSSFFVLKFMSLSCLEFQVIFFRKAPSYFFICSVSVQLLFELVVLLLLLLAAASNEVINQFFLLCYVAMDDDEFLSDAESGNGESEDDFAMNSEEDNNSDSMNVGKVLSSLDFVLFVHLCNIII